MDANTVALRKESVDRNCSPCRTRRPNIPSLSARRAWIEIEIGVPIPALPHVALRKESVDRNLMTKDDVTTPSGRSPQGERG